MTPADAIVFPESLLRQQTTSWRLLSQVVSGGRTGAGGFPLIRTDGGGLWLSDLSNVRLSEVDHIRAWRALEGLAEGGTIPFVVPMCDKRHGPFPIVDGKRLYSYGSIPHSDDTFFSDGSGYYQPVIDIVADSSALIRAEELPMAVNFGEKPQAGQYFSIEGEAEGWRLHLIKGVDDSGDVPIVKFTPPLREAVAEGQYIEFDQPRCTMRLAAPDAMSLDLDLGRTAAPSVSFVEFFFNA